MAEKDVTEKLLADYNDVFADIVNVLLFDGEQIVAADDLETVKALLEQAGMIFVAAMDEEGGPVTEHTERMQIIARECGKE